MSITCLTVLIHGTSYGVINVSCLEIHSIWIWSFINVEMALTFKCVNLMFFVVCVVNGH